MKFIAAFKAIIFLLVVSLLAVFFLQNRHAVYMQLPFAGDFRFGLIYLLLVSYTMGSISAFFTVFLISRKIKKRRRNRESQELIEEE